VCSTDASFAFSEVRIGVIPAVISATVLPRLSPRDAAELFLTGAQFDGVRAARIGLVNAAVPAAELDATVDRYVAELLRGAPGALAGTKALLRDATTLRDDLARLTELSVAYFRSAEGREGIQAFRKSAIQAGSSSCDTGSRIHAGLDSPLGVALRRAYSDRLTTLEGYRACPGDPGGIRGFGRTRRGRRLCRGAQPVRRAAAAPGHPAVRRDRIGLAGQRDPPAPADGQRGDHRGRRDPPWAARGRDRRRPGDRTAGVQAGEPRRR